MTIVHQILPTLKYGDAIGHHTMAIWDLLHAKDRRSRIYAINIDPRYARAAHRFQNYEDQPGNVLIYHYAIGSELTHFIRTLTHTRVVVYYHNITPAHFMVDVSPSLAVSLRQGREELRQLSSLPNVVHAIAASDYNRLELLDAGFRDVDVGHYLIDLEQLDKGAQTLSARQIREQISADADALKLVFVGRVVPNKCQHDLVHLVQYYRQLIDAKIQLWLVGSFGDAGIYVARLCMLITRYGLDAQVKLVGPVGPDNGLAAYYQSADAFVCMSEHEGFCVPLIEAMHFGLPVLAYESTGVPFTMGDAGVLFREKRFDMVAETLARLRADAAMRSRLIEGQRQRIKAFEIKTTRTKLVQLLDRLSAE